MSQNTLSKVESQVDLGAGHFLMRLSAPEIAPVAKAGEFVMIGIPDIDAMLIRRPFSIARVHPDPTKGTPHSIDILYKVFGQRTAAFSALGPGAELSLLGPLGRGFWLPDEDDETELMMVAGGIGNAIFPLLLQQAPRLRARATLYFGGRTKDDLTLVDWFEEHCARVVCATEDGSVGARGFVTAPLEAELDASPSERRLVLACGPTPMLKAVAEICIARDVPCQLALEETMACGFGVCLGCVVEKRDPDGDFDRFVRVCTEGPVFDAREVRL